MKKNLFIVAILAIAALTSCQKEQSQLDFNAVQEKAIVQGYVYIDKGYVQEGENYLLATVCASLRNDGDDVRQIAQSIATLVGNGYEGAVLGLGQGRDTVEFGAGFIHIE